MISLGRNIRQSNDPLTKITIETTYHKIRSPHQKLLNYIDQLRTVATIDAKKYRQLKIKLPYVVAGTFNPNYRKKDCFAFTKYFILDIDHVNEKDLNLDTLFNRITNDKRVTLAFRSPSNDGIKVFFELQEKCYDSGKFSMFYKFFAHKFSTEYQLNQVIDKTTSDVSRACFVSYDQNAYYNNNAETININKLIDFENGSAVSNIDFDIKKNEASFKDQNHDKEQIKNDFDFDKQDLPVDILQKIKERLNPKLKEKKEKNIYTPRQLDEIEKEIIKIVNEYEIEVEKIKNINYGKQFRFKIKYLWCELNVFYGKKGFTIVKTTKNGSDQNLADTCFNILTTVLNDA